MLKRVKIKKIIRIYVKVILTITVNILSEENRPQHWDQFVGSFKSPDRVLRGWTYRLTDVPIQEDAKV